MRGGMKVLQTIRRTGDPLDDSLREISPPCSRHTRHTRIKLMLAAEKLFGDHGIAGVSLRQIAQEAGHANNNVVQYHFQSKEGLIDTMMLWRVRMMEARRADMLREAEATGRLGDMETLLRILCLPHLDLVDENGRHPYGRFMSEYMFRFRATGVLHPYDRARELVPALTRTIGLIEKRLFFLPAPVARWRSRTCTGMFLQNLVYHDLSVASPDGALPLDQWVNDVLAMMVAAILVPPTSLEMTAG